MVVTVLEAAVSPERAAELRTAFQSAGAELPPGLLRTDLLVARDERTRWRIQSLWASADALAAMRRAGTPAGVLMFRAAGAEPTLTVFQVVASRSSSPQ